MQDQQTEKRTQALLPGNIRPWSEHATMHSARGALDTAVALARTGDRQGAREICAAVLFDAQPLIAARPELLRATVCALLAAHGFRLLSRLVLALSGRNVQVGLLPEQSGQIASPQCREEAGRTIYAVDPRWPERVAPDDMLLHHWCDALIARRPSRAKLPDRAPAARHLEPA
jgi:hypothetical protein